MAVEKSDRSKFQKHLYLLMWTYYLQRLRRWRILVVEMVFALMLFLLAVYVAKPVFLTPLEDQPEAPLSFRDILYSLDSDTILGYAPKKQPYIQIMQRTEELLRREIFSASSEDELNMILYQRSKGSQIINKVIWILWRPKNGNVFNISIRSTEVARYQVFRQPRKGAPNPHLRSGYLAVQLAISHALLEYSSAELPDYELSLVSMPVTPLMQQNDVRRVISLILMCYTVALLPPVLETEALVVEETTRRVKRALRIRDVGFSSIYFGWLTYAFLTACPICLLGSIILILIFRWENLLTVQLILLAYSCVMMMLALIMAMYHTKAKIAVIWSTLQTLLQTFLAELMVHHKYYEQHSVVTFCIHMFLPPLGLINALNNFALLQAGHDMQKVNSIFYMVLSWLLLISIYFGVLMLLQRTTEGAIGGQVSWKTIIFKKAEDPNELRPVRGLTGAEKEKLQEVDELVAKAITFQNVTKTVMNTPTVSNVTFDIYRSEYTMVVAERIQEKTINTIEDLIIGLTSPESGHVNVLGVDIHYGDGRSLMTKPNMMGYCDRSSYLIDDLSVEEHFLLYIGLCLWNVTSEVEMEYAYLRTHRLLDECDLEEFQHTRVKDLGVYYRAQLCWAIATLLEPRIVVVPNYYDDPIHMAVMRDKILEHKKYMTIVKMAPSSIDLEYADRIILLDSKILAFGGTPAYMFFKFGREYRLRVTFRNYQEMHTAELLQRIESSGASVRAHLGSLLIIRMPTSPSARVLELVEHLHLFRGQYGITSLNVSLPDTDEVFKRAIHQSRVVMRVESEESERRSRHALARIAESQTWTRVKRRCGFIPPLMVHMRTISWKYFTFYIHYRFFLIVTVISSIAAGAFIGLSHTTILLNLATDRNAKKLMTGQKLTVEAMEMKNTLVLRLGNHSQQARSVANAYVMSHTGAKKENVEKLSYIALDGTESLTEYLVTRAIDSPQTYLTEHAYGIDISERFGTIVIQALYSPLHHDQAAAARSLARVYMALLRHYTSSLDASILFSDDPLVLDLTPWMATATDPSLLVQFLLVLTIAHITLVPSKEYGLIRHMQSHAMNFSPSGYWCTLAFCHFIHYWMLVVIMSVVAFALLVLTVPSNHYHYYDLSAVPFMLIVYGIGCIPQAYLFSLGPRAPLNTMALIIVNIVFGEATIVGKLFHGHMYDYAVSFMALSPQYNMAYALVKIKRVFIYNSECKIFTSEHLCSSTVLNKCCKKCGILQECFQRQSYLKIIYPDVIATLVTATMSMMVLLMWEYRLIQLVWRSAYDKVFAKKVDPSETLQVGAGREKVDALSKEAQLRVKKHFRNLKLDTFGEYLLAVNLSRHENMYYVVRNVFLGVAKGETIAISGLRRHGRVMLCELLSGYKTRSEGRVYAMSKYKLKYSHHNYSKNVAYSSDRDPLPNWMTVYDALVMLAVLRGVPKEHIHDEVHDYIEALELWEHQDLLICRLQPSERKRLNFAAAVIGAPPILILDECTAYQNYVVRRAMYSILYTLKKRGHAIIHSAFNLETQMPVSNRLAIVRDGRIYDIDYIDNLLLQYTDKGMTVVVHLSDDVDIEAMFRRYFVKFTVNDTNEALANIQILDELTWDAIFKRMEKLKAENKQVYSYIVCAKPITYIYNSIISEERGFQPAADFLSRPYLRRLVSPKRKFEPPREKLMELKNFEKKYDITSLTELPWSVIFHR